jgi:signal transduction histidine kinase
MADDREQLFEKYQRGKNSSNTSGSGIGLWLVRCIIDQYHGTITLKNDALSVAATLRIPLSHTLNEQSS